MKTELFKEFLSWARIKKFFVEYGKLVLILFLITGSLIQGSRVPTPSMESTIMTGDFLIVNKLAYDLTTPRNIPLTNIALPFTRLFKWGNPERGDVVVFEFPGNRDEIKNKAIENFVKRCVAVGGDTLEIKNKIVFVNGKEIPIPVHAQYVRNFTMPKNYIEEGIFPKGLPNNGDNYSKIVVPKKDDVINLSLENIAQWETFINREYGKAVVEIVGNKIFVEGQETNNYKIKDDYYFMMGDNRDVSLDCRYWGFVPRRNVVGTPMFVFWSWDSNIPTTEVANLLSSIRFNRIGKIVR